MAQRKAKQQAPKTKISTNSSLKVRLQVKQVKAEIGKTREDQNCIREQQSRIRGRVEEIERQCDELKAETEMIVKQTTRTQIKLVIMFNILKAREVGDSVRVATLTHFLREFVSKERVNASLDDDNDEHLYASSDDDDDEHP